MNWCHLWSKLVSYYYLTHTGVYSDPEVVQSSPVVVKPGESFTISCKHSKTSCPRWISQAEGINIQYLGYGCTGGSNDVVNSFKNKISFRGDSSSSTVFLEGRNLQTEDTAVYYCARQSHCYTPTADLYMNPPFSKINWPMTTCRGEILVSNNILNCRHMNNEQSGVNILLVLSDTVCGE